MSEYEDWRETINGIKTNRYGVWGGCPKGHKFNPERCAEEIGEGFFFRQCTKKPGYGRFGMFCKQHAKRYPAKEASHV